MRIPIRLPWIQNQVWVKNVPETEPTDETSIADPHHLDADPDPLSL